jgi:hypothetical protein
MGLPQLGQRPTRSVQILECGSRDGEWIEIERTASVLNVAKPVDITTAWKVASAPFDALGPMPIEAYRIELRVNSETKEQHYVAIQPRLRGLFGLSG